MHVGQEDPSQVFALASVWLLIFGFGSSACLLPIIYSVAQAYHDAFGSGFSNINQGSSLALLATFNGVLFMLFGSVVGYPIASASGIKNAVQQSSHSDIDSLIFVSDDKYTILEYRLLCVVPMCLKLQLVFHLQIFHSEELTY